MMPSSICHNQSSLNRSSHPLHCQSLSSTTLSTIKYRTSHYLKHKQQSSHCSRQFVITSSSKQSGGGLGDDLLDFIVAGPKLRKWYGQEGQVLPRDGRDSDEDQPNNDDDIDQSGPRDNILILDADTIPMAEQVLLQLILARANIKATVKDPQQAKQSFGPYVDVIAANNTTTIKKTLSSRVSSVILCGSVDAQILSMIRSCGVPHIVLLSAVGAPSQGGLATFFSTTARELSALQDVKREEMVKQSGFDSYTIVRVQGLTDEQGGVKGIHITNSGSNTSNTTNTNSSAISREDAAKVIAEASLLQQSVLNGKSAVFSIRKDENGSPPQNWESLFASIV